MSYIYGCKICKISFEIDRKVKFWCNQCGSEMELIATEKWSFKCFKCEEIVMGSPETECSVAPCPFCEGGMLIPYRKI